MTCRRLAPDIVDLARREPLDPFREAAIMRHLRASLSCAALLEQQRTVSVALRRLATEDNLPRSREGERALPWY
jgi:hypothetical protein